MSKYKLEGIATYKQSWKIANMFADQLVDEYPEYSRYSLVRLFKGTIYYYHQSKGYVMSKVEASEIITNDTPCPQYYLDHLNSFLKEPEKFIDKIDKVSTKKTNSKKKKSTIQDSSDGNLDFLKIIASAPRS
jgi:hypothetical protein